MGFFGLYLTADQIGWVLQGDNILITYFVFTAFFAPHIFQMFARTHLDTQEFNCRRFLYTWGLGLFIAVGFLITAPGWESELIVLASIFGTWHIIRQHYGFIRAYKSLNNDTEELMIGWITACFTAALLPVFFNDYTDIKEPIVIYRELTAHFFNLPYEITEIT